MFLYPYIKGISLKKRLTFLAIVLLLTSGMIIYKITLPDTIDAENKTPASSLFQTAPIHKEPVEYHRLLIGSVVSESEAPLSFKAFGRVNNIYVSEGEYVSRGQILATLTADEQYVQQQMAETSVSNIAKQLDLMNQMLDSQVENAKDGKSIYEEQKSQLEKQLDAVEDAGNKQLEIYKTQLEAAQNYDPSSLTAEELAQAEYEEEIAQETFELTEKSIEAEKQQIRVQIETLDKTITQTSTGVTLTEKQKEAQLQEVKTQLDMSQGQLDLANVALENTRIYAPFDGYITSQFVEKGQVIPAGQPVFNLANTTYLVKTDISDKKVHQVNEGMTAYLQVEGIEQEFLGTVSKVFPKVDPYSKNIPLEISFSTQSDQLIIGQLVRVKLESPMEMGYFLPRRFVQAGFDGPYIILEDGTKQPVSLGVELTNTVQISYDQIESGVNVLDREIENLTVEQE